MLSPGSYTKHVDNLIEVATPNKEKEPCKRNLGKQKECDVKQTIFDGMKEFYDMTNNSSSTSIIVREIVDFAINSKLRKKIARFGCCKTS